MFKNGRSDRENGGGRLGLVTDDPTAGDDAKIFGNTTVLRLSLDYLDRRPFLTTNTRLATRRFDNGEKTEPADVDDWLRRSGGTIARKWNR